MSIGKILFYQPIISGLFLFYHLTGNLGWAIVLLTIVIRLLLLPLTLPSLKAAAKIQQLAPELEKLKKKYKNDRKKLSQAQMELYRRHKINPTAGCLPQIIQILVLITLYQVFRDLLISKNTVTQINELVYSFLRLPAGAVLQTKFFYLDLAKPDTFLLGGKPFPGLFLWLAVITQFFSAKLSLPRVKKEEKLAGKTVSKEDDFAVAFQKQSLYLFPLMTLIFGLSFPSGLVVYWAVFSLTNLFQQLALRKINWSEGGKKNG